MNTITIIGITTIGATLALASFGQTQIANTLATIGAISCFYALRREFTARATPPAEPPPAATETVFDLEPETETAYNATMPNIFGTQQGVAKCTPATVATTYGTPPAITNGQIVQFLDRCCLAAQRLNLNPAMIPSYESLKAAGVAVSPNQRQVYLRLLRNHIVKIRAGNSERWIVKRGSVWQLLQAAQRGALKLAD